MPDTEQVEIKANEICALITGCVLSRKPNGEWRVLLSLNGELRIDADRTLPVRGQAKMSARQIGRKPNTPAKRGK